MLRGSATQGFSVLGRYDLPIIDDILPWSIVEGEGRIYVTETPGEAAYSELELELASGQWHWRFY